MPRPESLVFAMKAKDMATAIVEVQQNMSDISATRAANCTKQGFYKRTDRKGGRDNEMDTVSYAGEIIEF